MQQKTLQGDTDFSDEIIFKTRLITDYSESVSNRVLSIDDISGLFNSNRRTTPFEVVSKIIFTRWSRAKFLCLVKDTIFTAERQMSLVTVVNSRVNGQSMISQYGDVDTLLTWDPMTTPLKVVKEFCNSSQPSLN